MGSRLGLETVLVHRSIISNAAAAISSAADAAVRGCNPHAQPPGPSWMRHHHACRFSFINGPRYAARAVAMALQAATAAAALTCQKRPGFMHTCRWTPGLNQCLRRRGRSSSSLRRRQQHRRHHSGRRCARDAASPPPGLGPTRTRARRRQPARRRRPLCPRRRRRPQRRRLTNYFFFADKIRFFANFVAFSPSGVSFSPSGVSFSPVSTFTSLRQSS